jgi:hypothetical protein
MSTLASEGETIVEVRGAKPNRQIVALDLCHKPSCRFVLWVEDADGWLSHDGGRFMYERAAASPSDL